MGIFREIFLRRTAASSRRGLLTLNKRSRPIRPTQLAFESLEDRRLLAVFSVDNLNDSGTGSLREAITLANADSIADEITFSVTGTIDLASQLPIISQPLTITGPGQSLLTLDAGDGADNTFGTGDGYRIFNVSNFTAIIDVEIRGLTLTGGDTGTVSTSTNPGGAIRNVENLTIRSSTIIRNAAPRGGGIYNRSDGSVTIIASTIEENRAVGELGGFGGGIYSFGNSTIQSSTLSGNTATARGGGLYSSISPMVTITGSTVSGNSAGTLGGGIAVFGTLNLTSSTITGNEAFQTGGGISSFFSSTLNVISSIVAGNRAGSSDNIQGSLDINTQNLIDVDPLLGPLADNGGPTKTHALLPGSPALDAGLAPVHVYELDGTLTDAMGGPDLAALGGSIFIPAGEYHFGPNQGLNLSSANIDPTEYTIEIDFSFDALSGFQKILDFKNLVADAGLYTLDDTLRFFGPSFSSGSILAVDTLHHLVLSRDGATDEVRASIDGTEVFSFVDTGGSAVFSATDQIIRFFQDDNATGQGEAESGFVDRIRIFDAAIESNDQRGAKFNRIVGSAIDIGAYEAQMAPSADFDSDGDVDGADFLSWQRGFGKANAVRTDGNSDDDTDVDTSDLTAWSTTFGQEATSLAAIVSSGLEVMGRRQSAGGREELTDAALSDDALLDAAIAMEWLGSGANEEAKFVAEPAIFDAKFVASYKNDLGAPGPAASRFAEHVGATTVEDKTNDAYEPWLVDDLMERVFG